MSAAVQVVNLLHEALPNPATTMQTVAVADGVASSLPTLNTQTDQVLVEVSGAAKYTVDGSDPAAGGFIAPNGFLVAVHPTTAAAMRFAGDGGAATLTVQEFVYPALTVRRSADISKAVTCLVFENFYDRMVRELRQNPETWVAQTYQQDLLCDYMNERLQRAYEQEWWTRLCPVIARDVVDTGTGRYVPYGATDAAYVGAVRRVVPEDPALADYDVKPLAHSLSDRGIELRPDSPDTVYIQIRVQAPRVTRSAYNNGTSYAAGALVWWRVADGGTGDCYLALDAVSGVLPSDATRWERQCLPAMFQRYVSRGVSADYWRVQGDRQELANADSGRAAAELDRLQFIDREQQDQQNEASVTVY